MSDFKSLEKYGWEEFFRKDFEQYSKNNYTAGRVAIENKSNFNLYTVHGELTGEISGRFHYNAKATSDYPAVGDWVVIRIIPGESKAIIEHVLRRKNKFSRKAAGDTTDEQIIAANADLIFIVTSLNQDINLRRIERYLTLASENNAVPVLILSKSDVCENEEEKISEVSSIAAGIDIHSISAKENIGIEELKKYFSDNRTVAVVGSSGVGKSTLINCLTGSDEMEVSEIGLYKDKGRHTTSHRELLLIEGGGLIIDTPGMREIQLWEGNEGMGETFADVEEISVMCRFTDCRHDTEPGCAIKKAIEEGILTEERFNNYVKLQKEVRYFEIKQDKRAQIEEKKKWKKLRK